MAEYYKTEHIVGTVDKVPEPYLRVVDMNGQAHFISVDTFKMYVTGNLPISGIPVSVLKKVVFEWMLSLGVTK